MTKEKFINIINIIINLLKKQDELFNITSGVINLLNAKEIIDAIDSLTIFLKEEFNDENDWIEYYLYELDCGKKWVPGTVTFDDVDIKLSTPEDLYNILKSEVTHYDEIRAMSKEEFANYIHSVFIAGKLAKDTDEYENYNEWLDSKV